MQVPEKLVKLVMRYKASVKQSVDQTTVSAVPGQQANGIWQGHLDVTRG